MLNNDILLNVHFLLRFPVLLTKLLLSHDNIAPLAAFTVLAAAEEGEGEDHGGQGEDDVQCHSLPLTTSLISFIQLPQKNSVIATCHIDRIVHEGTWVRPLHATY